MIWAGFDALDALTDEVGGGQTPIRRLKHPLHSVLGSRLLWDASDRFVSDNAAGWKLEGASLDLYVVQVRHHRQDPLHGRVARRALPLILALVGVSLLAMPGRVDAQTASLLKAATMTSEAGDPIGAGTDRVFDVTGAVSMHGTLAGATVRLGRLGEERFTIGLAPASGMHLAVGEYGDAERSPSAGHPGLSVSGGGRACGVDYGRFVIRDVQVGKTGALARLWLTYEQHCERPSAPALFGEVRIGEPPPKAPESPLPSSVQWPRTTTGTRTAVVPVSVVGGRSGGQVSAVAIQGGGPGEFSVARDDCLGVALPAGGQCELAVAARPSAPGDHAASVLVTDKSGETTKVPLAVSAEPLLQGNSATLVSEPGDWVGGGSDQTVATLQNVVVLGDAGRAEIRAESGGEWYSFAFAAPKGANLTTGEYNEAQRSGFAEPGFPGIAVGVRNRGCNTDEGRFTIKDLAFGGSGAVTRLWALYEQRCETPTSPALFGELRIGEPTPPTPETTLPTAVEWPHTTVGGSDVTVPVTIFGGESGGAVDSVVVEGEDAGEFAVAGLGCQGALLGPSEHCEVAVTAKPAASGRRAAELVVTDASGTKTRVPLAVNAERPPPRANDFATFVEEPGGLGQEERRLFETPASFELQTEQGTGTVRVAAKQAPESFHVSFTPPRGHQLQAGEYANAGFIPPEGLPGLSVDVDGSSCALGAGRFVIKEIAYDNRGKATLLVATYEDHCKESPGAMFGEVSVGKPPAQAPATTIPGSVEWPATPADSSGVHVPVYVRGGESGGHVTGIKLEGPDAIDFRVAADQCEGATLQPGERCLLELTVTPTAGGVRTAQLLITDATGSVASVPLSVAATPALEVNSATLVSEPGDFIGQGQDHTFELPRTVWLTTQGGTTQGERVQTSIQAPGNWFSVDFAAPYGKKLEVGTYNNAEGSPEANSGHPGLDVSGDARGCNRSYGRFVVRDIHYSESGVVDRLWANYEQHCETPTSPALFGEVRIGEPAPAAAEATIPAAVEWPTTKVGVAGASVEVSVVAGEAGGRIVSVTLEGEDSSDFNVANGCATWALQPGEHCIVTVRPKPAAPGLRSAQLIITDASGTRTALPLAVDAGP